MNGSTEAHHIDFARLVFPERRNVQCGIEQQIGRAACQRENFARAVIAEYVRARRQRRCRAAVDIASGDGTAPSRVTVLRDRRDKIRRRAESGIETGAIGALVHAPPVVPACGHDVDLFQRALSDVADIQLSRLRDRTKIGTDCAFPPRKSHRDPELRRQKDCPAARSTAGRRRGGQRRCEESSPAIH